MADNPGTVRIQHPLLQVSIHHFDWAPLLKTDRPALSVSRHARLLGLGFDYRLDQLQRRLMLSFGHSFLLNLALGMHRGVRLPAPADLLAGPAYLQQPSAYVELTLLGFKACLSSDQGLRFFFRHRRLFPKPKD